MYLRLLIVYNTIEAKHLEKAKRECENAISQVQNIKNGLIKMLK